MTQTYASVSNQVPWESTPWEAPTIASVFTASAATPGAVRYSSADLNLVARST